MASNTQGIQRLLAAEKKAADKVGEARKRNYIFPVFIRFPNEIELRFVFLIFCPWKRSCERSHMTAIYFFCIWHFVNKMLVSVLSVDIDNNILEKYPTLFLPNNWGLEKQLQYVFSIYHMVRAIDHVSYHQRRKLQRIFPHSCSGNE